MSKAQVTFGMCVPKQRKMQGDEKLATLCLSPCQGVSLFQSCMQSLVAESCLSLDHVALKMDKRAREIVRAAYIVVRPRQVLLFLLIQGR